MYISVKEILYGIGGVILTGIGLKVLKFFERRVKVSSPADRAMEQLVPTVNMMSTTYGAVLSGVKTLLEVAKGQCNGNVEDALKRVCAAQIVYEQHVSEVLEVQSDEV